MIAAIRHGLQDDGFKVQGQHRGGALEQALITRNGTLGRACTPFLLRSDNGLVFTSRSYTAMVRGCWLRQEFITPHCPQQNAWSNGPSAP